MPVIKAQKKPVQIEAIQWTGNNLDEILNFLGDCVDIENKDKYILVWDKINQQWLNCNISNYIIKGLKGEFYPCDEEIFKQSYEVVG